jgi:4-hydroxy-tetrahydrodipicolinate synthase
MFAPAHTGLTGLGEPILSKPKKLGGIIVPLATPLLDRGRIDHPSLARLLDHVIAGGISGVFVLGTTGEGPGLSPDARREAVHSVCLNVAGRVPVLVGVSDTSAVETLRLTEYAAQEGAAAAVLAPPFYFVPGQEELIGYFERVIPQLALPVYLYNIPSLTKVPITPETARAATAIPGVSGFKDSSGDMEYFAAIRAAMPAERGFEVFCGPEELLAEALRLGADGGVCGGANLFPELYVGLCRAFERGQHEAVAQLQSRILDVSGRIYNAGEGNSSYLRGLKCALQGLDLCSDNMAEPFSPLGEPLRSGVGAEAREIRRQLAAFLPRNGEK